MSELNEHLLQNPTPDLLIWAYANAVFPMADPDTNRIEWFRPHRRGIIPIEMFHVPKSLARVVRSGRFDVRCDAAFEEVMRQCASPRGLDNESWINERSIEAYVNLHDAGHAHSVEAYRHGKLVGGLYGVHLGAAFFGESMFVRPEQGGTDASKVCLVHLVNHLHRRGFTLLDTQFWNPHLTQFGCEEIDAEAYDNQIRAYLDGDYYTYHMPTSPRDLDPPQVRSVLHLEATATE